MCQFFGKDKSRNETIANVLNLNKHILHAMFRKYPKDSIDTITIHLHKRLAPRSPENEICQYLKWNEILAGWVSVAVEG